MKPMAMRHPFERAEMAPTLLSFQPTSHRPEVVYVRRQTLRIYGPNVPVSDEKSAAKTDIWTTRLGNNKEFSILCGDPGYRPKAHETPEGAMPVMEQMWTKDKSPGDHPAVGMCTSHRHRSLAEQSKEMVEEQVRVVRMFTVVRGRNTKVRERGETEKRGHEQKP